jgi:hypothetical protein
LGVICDLVSKEHSEIEVTDGDRILFADIKQVKKYNDNSVTIHQSIQTLIGVDHECVQINKTQKILNMAKNKDGVITPDGDQFSYLTTLNDTLQLTFNEIADIIEEQL